MIRPLLLLAALATPAAAQIAEPEFGTDMLEVGVLSCDLDGAEIGCLTEIDEAMTFCTAYDAADEPLANSITVSDEGIVVFRNIDPTEVAALRCRPNA
jgi:hypothetical protein